ncbi:hypothetical protein LXL04_029731 [Taraxacum kok-saghyz]
MFYDNGNLTTPNIRWLGITFSEFTYEILDNFQALITREKLKRLHDMKSLTRMHQQNKKIRGIRMARHGETKRIILTYQTSLSLLPFDTHPSQHV